MKPGNVFWFTGLSGVGKTTLATLFYQRLAEKKSNVVLLDGDRLREVFGQDLGYAPEDRRRSAMRNSQLCRLLAEQGIDVVCATISLFHDCQDWNRRHIARYFEIYITASLEVLVQRDKKGIYRRTGDEANRVGLDFPAEAPRQPELTLQNDGTVSPQQLIETIWNRFQPFG